ncbi:hypothetical protein [Comamonas sp. lk]|uniref:hypothetical protein n=1 Tax=Comamonas sp. lk TaxID=2201272 RepID=UPI000EACB730|nr:hypothetical protein [Comamonas sp. lk]
MIKLLGVITLAFCSVLLLMLWATGPAQANAETSEPPSPPGAIRMAARDAFACPGMHAEWIDEKTVHCLKEKP